MPAPPDLPTFELRQTLGFGFHFPTRMTVLPLSGGGLALVSPIPIDEERARSLEALGTVRYLIAPNLFHNLYLADACRRFPDAEVLAPQGLSRKRPDLRIDRTLDAPLPSELASAVEVIHIEGAPSVDEFVFFHRESETLVATDLAFNIEHPEGLLTHVILAAVGCRGRLATSRAWRVFSRDRGQTRASVRRLLSLPFRTLVVAHGAVVRENAKEGLTRGLGWLADAAAPRLTGGAPDVSR